MLRAHCLISLEHSELALPFARLLQTRRLAYPSAIAAGFLKLIVTKTCCRNGYLYSRNIRGPFVVALDKSWCPEHFLCDKVCRIKCIKILLIIFFQISVDAIWLRLVSLKLRKERFIAKMTTHALWLLVATAAVKQSLAYVQELLRTQRIMFAFYLIDYCQGIER